MHPVKNADSPWYPLTFNIFVKEFLDLFYLNGEVEFMFGFRLSDVLSAYPNDLSLPQDCSLKSTAVWSSL